MRVDDEKESSNVEDRRFESGGGGSSGKGVSLGTILMFWPFIKMLTRSKVGWVLIAVGV